MVTVRFSTDGIRAFTTASRKVMSIWVLEFGDELLKLWLAAKVFQIVIGHQSIGILVPAMDGFLQILQRVVGAIGGLRYTGEVIPHRPRVSQS